VTLDNMVIQRGGADATIGDCYFAPIVGDGGMAAMGCTFNPLGSDSATKDAPRDHINENVDSFATFIFGHNHAGASLSVSNSTIRQNAQYVQRSNGNCYGSGGTTTNADIEACDPAYSAGGITFDNNTIYSVFGLANGHQGRGWTWTDNTIYDFYGGIVAEENVDTVDFSRNDISCRGWYKTDRTGKCKTAIGVDDGDQGEHNCDDGASGTLPHCGTRHVTIGGNKIWGANYLHTGSTGNLQGGIFYNGHNSSSQNGGAADATIENNFIYYTQSSSGCHEYPTCPANTGSCGATPNADNITESPLSIATNDSVTVQNNTIYKGGCPVYLRTGFYDFNGGTGSVAHTFRDNIIDYGHYEVDGSDVKELIVDQSAAGSSIQNNDLYYGSDSSSSIVACMHGTGDNCRNGQAYTCVEWVANAGAGNLCTPVTFCGVVGSHPTALGVPAVVCGNPTPDLSNSSWDLHLNGAQDIINAGILAATIDIDQENRAVQASCTPKCTDIGADEWLQFTPAAPQSIIVPDYSGQP
jgi:hypothetical protein